ncbi:MAG: tetratricopeptide repeat protein [Sphingomonadales bacterium]
MSSTFRDFGEERDLLVRRVFPALRARLRERFVELVDVDLRWGITAEQAERGEVLPICLAEIDRARPWFVGMLGDRYGWVPEADAYDPGLVEQRPWLDEHRGGTSVTELEILHGVINDPAMAGRALFYFRDPAYAKAKGGDYVSALPEDNAHLEQLKDRIRASGFPVVEGYPTPAALADRLEADLWAVLDAAFPVEEVPDAFSREERRHEAYGAPRRRLYLGGEAYIVALDAAVGEGAQRVLVSGQSGGGKSALIANWSDAWRRTQPNDQLHVWYLGASADAASSASLVRNLLERIKRVTDAREEIPGDPQALYDSISTWLAYASAHAGLHNYRWVIVLDALNGLTDLRDLRWWPSFLPDRVQIVVSCLLGPVMEALEGKGEWHRIEVEPLNIDESRTLLRTYLGNYNKVLAADLEDRALAHPLAINPLFLTTLAEELRLFGSHEELSSRLDGYLTSITVDDLFERVLERIEGDHGADVLRKVMVALWASRAGLTEAEILAYASLVPATWAPIRLTLDEALTERGGRIALAHDYMRLAVSDRYLAGNNTLQDEGQSEEALKLRRQAHTDLAEWFGARFAELIESDRAKQDQATDRLVDDARAAEEIPFQWQAAGAWQQLAAALTKREMFEAVEAHRTDGEHLSYWLGIEANTGLGLEAAFEEAWGRWAPDEALADAGKLASQVKGFLHVAGRYCTFTLRLAQLAVAIAERVQGSEHADTGGRLINLSNLLFCMGDYDTAEPLYRQGLEITKKVLGAEHPNTATSIHNLALLLEAKGDYGGAEPLMRQALLIIEKALGPEHPDTGTFLNSLANIIADKGDYETAEALYRRALAIAEKTGGPGHPDTGQCLGNIAILLHDKGDYDGAEPLMRQALLITEKAQGPEHPATGIFLNSLANLLRDKGDHEAAEALYRRALAIAEKANGPEHPLTGLLLHNLANLSYDQGDYDTAELLYGRALIITEKVLGPNHPQTGANLAALATILDAKGNHEAAEPLYRRALVIAEQAHGPEYLRTGNILWCLGNLLAEISRIDEALTLLRREADLVQKSEGERSPSLAESMHNLGVLLRNSGRLEEASADLHKALTIWEAQEGGVASPLASTLSALGDLCAEKAEYDDARGYYERCLEVRRTMDPPDEEGIALVEQRLEELNCKL